MGLPVIRNSQHFHEACRKQLRQIPEYSGKQTVNEKFSDALLNCFLDWVVLTSPFATRRRILNSSNLSQLLDTWMNHLRSLRNQDGEYQMLEHWHTAKQETGNQDLFLYLSYALYEASDPTHFNNILGQAHAQTPASLLHSLFKNR